MANGADAEGTDPAAPGGAGVPAGGSRRASVVEPEEGWEPDPWTEFCLFDGDQLTDVIDTSGLTVPGWDRERFGQAAQPTDLVPRLAGERVHPLEAEPTGPHLATLLEFFDPATLRDASLVDFLAAGERLKAWVDARQVAATLELSGRCARLRGVGSGGPEAGEMPVEAMAAAEIAPALRLCTRSAEERVRLAGALVRLAGTRALLAPGS